MNVTAGIGILEKAAPMITDFFADSSAPVSATAAAGFVALLSAANMAGRIGWSTTSDLIGRKNIYRVYLGVGALMYALIWSLGDSSKPLFVLAALVILSFYGGGFATVPAYLKDLFGTYQVGAIHGRCSPPGPPPACSDRSSSTGSPTGRRRPASTARPCTASPWSS